jgi:hypothetical protein
MMRPVAALALSTIIAGGTWFTVTKTNQEAQRTADGITQQVLDAQTRMQENAAQAQREALSK